MVFKSGTNEGAPSKNNPEASKQTRADNDSYEIPTSYLICLTDFWGERLSPLIPLSTVPGAVVRWGSPSGGASRQRGRAGEATPLLWNCLPLEARRAPSRN